MIAIALAFAVSVLEKADFVIVSILLPPIFVTYYDKANLRYIVDKPVYYSALKKDGKNRNDIAKMLVERCNVLGKMSYEENVSNDTVKDVVSK